MQAFFTPFGIYPNNAIVADRDPITPGAAIVQAREPQARHRRLQHRRRIVCLRAGVGRHHLRQMEQYRRLWVGTALAAAFRSSTTA